MGDRDAVLHLLNFVSEKWGFECFNALGQAYPATRDQRCLTSFYIHCHGSGDIVLDHEQRLAMHLLDNLLLFDHLVVIGHDRDEQVEQYHG